MYQKNKNPKISEWEQDGVLAMHDSYLHFKQEWESSITFGEYISAIRFAYEHEKIAELFRDDRRSRFEQGEQ